MDNVAFDLKKIVTLLIMPVALASAMFALALVSVFKRWRRLGLVFICIGGLVLYISSIRPMSYLLTRPLETRFGMYMATGRIRDIGPQYIVVLGGDRYNSKLLPPESVGKGTFRLMEGLRLWSEFRNATLIRSLPGFPTNDSEAKALFWAYLAKFGVPDEKVKIESKALDTDDEAAVFAPIIRNKPTLLVTSGLHMSRSLMLFEKHGARPNPAPCDFVTVGRRIPFYKYLLPDANAALYSEMAIHEYLGMVWARLREIGRSSWWRQCKW